MEAQAKDIFDSLPFSEIGRIRLFLTKETPKIELYGDEVWNSATLLLKWRFRVAVWGMRFLLSSAENVECGGKEVKE